MFYFWLKTFLFKLIFKCVNYISFKPTTMSIFIINNKNNVIKDM